MQNRKQGELCLVLDPDFCRFNEHSEPVLVKTLLVKSPIKVQNNIRFSLTAI